MSRFSPSSDHVTKPCFPLIPCRTIRRREWPTTVHSVKALANRCVSVLVGALACALATTQPALAQSAVDGFDPGADGAVRCLTVQPDGRILVGGEFSTLAGLPRSRMGRLNSDGSLDNTFTNGANNHVEAIAVQPDGKILVGGTFNQLAGQARNYIGRLNSDGSLDNTFTNGADNWVYALALQADGKILVGGEFTTLAGQAHSKIGRLNPDGSLDNTFTNGANLTVDTITVQADGRILVGGTFNTLAGQARDRIGRLNLDGTIDNTFTNGASSTVAAIGEQVDGKILVGGNFTQLAGQARNYIGRLNSDGSLDNTFTNGANNWVYTLVLQSDGKIVVGGEFTTLAGQARSRIGRLNSDGSSDNTFTNGAGSVVDSISLQADGKILVGGTFTNLAAQTRNRIGRLYPDGSLDVSLTNGANTTVMSLAVQPSGKILLAGDFATLAGQARNRIGRLNAGGSLDTTFTNGGDSAIYAVAQQPDGKVLVGGGFTTLAGQAHNSIGRFNANGLLDNTFTNGADGGNVAALAVQPDGRILAAGYFTILAGQARSRLGRLNADGSLDNAFTNGADNTILSVALQPDGKILVGGNFTTLAGQPRNGIGRLNADGSLDNTFTNDVDAGVFAIAVQPDGKILLGGNFTNLAGQARSRVGRLNADGSLDATFTNGVNSSVNSFALQADGRILVSGYLTTLAGQPRNYIGRLNADGSLDNTFTNGASLQVNSISVQPDGKILVGGGFTTIAGRARNYMARLVTPEAALQSLDVDPDGTRVTWRRSGAAPEVWRTTFEVSTNGTDWIMLGAGVRTTNGWQITGLSLPKIQIGYIRARGFVVGGIYNGSQGIVESIRVFYVTLPPADMCEVSSGPFLMGDAFGDGAADELPVHTAVVSRAYYVDRYEVTKSLWDDVAGWAATNGYDIGAGNADGKASDHPAQTVSWYDCVKWCNARSEKAGFDPCYYTSSNQTTVYRTGSNDLSDTSVNWDADGYRLPTEVEWEKAARGGVSGRRFPWSGTNTISHSQANYYSTNTYAYDTSPTRGNHPAYTNGGMPYTAPVGSFAPNGYGLYDMAGNVFEWCWEWHPDFVGTYRIFRGGDWTYRYAYHCRASYRPKYFPYMGSPVGGFRCVRVEDQLSSGLVAYYPFNGNANDESGNGRNGVVFGATNGAGRLGTPSTAYAFDGYDDEITVSAALAPNVTTSVTFSAWFRLEYEVPPYDTGVILKKGQYLVDGTYNIGVGTTSGCSIAVNAGGVNRQVFDTTTVNLDTWRHVVGVYNGSSLSLYVDGHLKGSTPASGVLSSNASPLCIGNDYLKGVGEGTYIKGKIDEVRVYDRALTSNEVDQLYNVGNVDGDGDGLPDWWEQQHFGGLAQTGVGDYDADGRTNLEEFQDGTDPAQSRLGDGLVAYYPFNGNANDESGNGRNGVVFGATNGAGRLGTPSTAYAFDGYDDEITVSAALAPNVTTSVTFSAWFRLEYEVPPYDTGVILKKGQYLVDGTYNIGVGTTSGCSIAVNAGGVNRQVFDTTTVNLDTWRHVVGVYNGSSLSLYVDGHLKGSTPASGVLSSNASPLCIGNDYLKGVGEGTYIKGRIDEARIYGRALSSNEVWQLSGSGLPVVHNALGTASITPNSAVLNGNVTGGDGTNAFVGVYWGPTDGGTNAIAWMNMINLGVLPVGAFSTTITGLANDVTYYYRCLASNSAGAVWAPATASFSTLEAYQLSQPMGSAGGGNALVITNIALGNGSDITNVTIGAASAAITGQGTNWVSVTVPAGGTGVVSIAITSTSMGTTTLPDAYIYEQPPVVRAAATPVSGPAPLRVTFDTTASTDPDTHIVRWEVDRGGDGTFESTWPDTGVATVEYGLPGTYTSGVRVVDDYGAIDQTSFVVTVWGSAPQARLTVTPGSGAAGTAFALKATNSMAGIGYTLVSYEFDPDGDGIFNRLSSNGILVLTYGTSGTNHPAVRVTDNRGLQASTSVVVVVTTAPSPPVVTLSATPDRGTLPLTVVLTAVATDNVGIVSYRWDFDGDGDDDRIGSGNCVTQLYTEVGTYAVRVRVVDTTNLSAEDATPVQVTQASLLKAWISTPKDGWDVSGAEVTVHANTAPGHLTASVQLQYKLSSTSIWSNLGAVMLPPANSFKTSWDATGLVNGQNYDLRVVALDTATNMVYSDTVTVTVAVWNNEPGDMDESDSSGKHTKQQKGSTNEATVVVVLDGTQVTVPAETTATNPVVHLEVTGANTNPLSGSAVGTVSLNENRKVSIDGDPALGKAIEITIPYPDADNDGFVDGTQIPEGTLMPLWYDTASVQWRRPLAQEVDKTRNEVKLKTYHLTEFGLFGTANLLAREMGGQLQAFSSQYDGARGAAYLTDGNPASYWRSQNAPTNQVFLYGWTNWQGAVLTAIVLHNYGEAGEGRTNYSRNFIAERSMDGSNFMMMVSNILPVTEEPQTYPLGVQTCRWVRLTIQSGVQASAWELAEFTVQGALTNDADADAMTDAWEKQYFNHFNRTGMDDLDGDLLNDRQEHAAGGNPTVRDTDGDGQSDFDEWVAGTGLDNGAERFDVNEIVFSTNVVQFILRWDTVTGRTYSVVSRTNLITGTWGTNLGGVIGDGTPKAYTNQDAIDNKYFRIRVTGP